VRPFVGTTAFSVTVHVLAFGIPYYFLVIRSPEAAVVELDLSPVATMPGPARTRAAAPVAQAWSHASSIASAARAGTQEEPAADSACPPPCPDRPGDYVPAGLTVNGPRWLTGFITDDDYPAEARRLGVEGTVLLAVFITADGTVREVRLARGTHPSLDAVALAKVQGATFSPARDGQGRPIPCKLMLPIRFELK